MIDIMSILTAGVTGLLFGAVLVMILANMAKAGLFGPISRWIAAAKDKVSYGRRVLLTALCLSSVVSALQWAAIPQEMNHWIYVLRVLGCALLASGGYEYVKTITKPFVKGGDSDVGKS